MLETSGWSKANPGAQTAFASALETLSSAGLSIVDRRSEPEIEAVERAVSEAMKITRAINAWESRWPMNIYRDRDASKLSKSILKRLHEAESMSIDDYRSALAIRSEARRSFARLADLSDLCVTLSASSGAPLGLDSTGNPAFAAPSSFLGVPALSLPLLSDEGLPLGFSFSAPNSETPTCLHKDVGSRVMRFNERYSSRLDHRNDEVRTCIPVDETI